MDFWTLLILLAIFRGVAAWWQRRNAQQQGEAPPRPRPRPRPRPQRTQVPTPTPQRPVPLPEPTMRRAPGPISTPQSRWPEPMTEWEASEAESVPEWTPAWQGGADRESREITVGEAQQLFEQGLERELLERLSASAEAAVAERSPRQAQPVVAASEPVAAPPRAVTRSARWVRDELRDPESVRTALVLREVLGPPRAHRRPAR